MRIDQSFIDEKGFLACCERCGKKGIMCDNDLEILWKGRFYPVEHLTSHSARVDDLSGLCEACMAEEDPDIAKEQDEEDEV